ncbi:MAG: 6-bladed beta-propeller [Betaproteobacteria bacterium]|nr:MAG: 6-bladed beta-propeller [Betaproteobacteria bacterium]
MKQCAWLGLASVIWHGRWRKARIFRSSAILLAVALTGACASAPEESTEKAPLAFPPPPEQPRLIYEMTLVSSTQVTADKKDSWREMITGEIKRGEGFVKPFDVSVCRGTVYVSDTVRRRVLVFDFPARRFYRIGDDEPGALYKPLGLATDAQCRLYVADASLQRVMIYEKSGAFVNAVGGPDWFRFLSHLTVNSDGSRVYAVDTGGVSSQEHRIRVFDAVSGEHLRDIGTRGTDEGQFNLPRDVELSADGKLYIVDGGNFRVQILDENGAFVRTFGSLGAQFGQFSRPKGIAADPAGNIYVSDTAFGNFQIFNTEGQLLLFVGGRSNQPGPARYSLPAGIDVDEDGRVYFVDQFFRKIDIYRPAELAREDGYLAEKVNEDAARAQDDESR